MNPKVKSMLLIGLATLVILFAISLGLVHWHSAGNWGGGLFLFDQDYSDSVGAWMIAIPVVLLVLLLVGAVLVFTGIFVAGVLVLVFGAVVLAVGVSLLPIALIFAVPALAVYGFFKLLQRDRAVQPV